MTQTSGRMFPQDAPAFLSEYDASRIPPGFRTLSGKHGHPWAEWTEPIAKSENDTRDYKLIRLDNGLEALLVSDPDTDRAAANLTVRIGCMHDPPELPGLAHFTEHLLFCGSQKFPLENEYSSYISKYGGSCNASTEAEYTSYEFSMTNQSKFAGALDRMSALFKSPLFEPTVVEREIKAIQSEFERFKQCDPPRFDQIKASLSKKGHPFAKFGTGNLKTLWKEPKAKGIDVRKELIRFHAQNYSANLMRLCVVASHHMNTLTEMVSGMFSDLPFRNVPPTVWPGHPMGSELMRHQLYIKRVRRGDKLHIEFPLGQDLRPCYETQPGYFLASLIGHESGGSLLSYLKSKSWATALYAGAADSATGWSGFELIVDLTPAGKASQSDIIVALFSYLEMLRAAGPSERIFQEYSLMAATEFRFEEKGEPSDLAAYAAKNLHEPWPRSCVLSQPHTANKFDADLITSVLADLQPDRMLVAYCSPEEAEAVDYNQAEPIYESKYAIKELSRDLLERCRCPPQIANLHLPHVNPFVPVGVHKVSLDDTNPEWTLDSTPLVIKEEPGLRVWYQQDVEFLNPKSFVGMACRSPLAFKSARESVMMQLFSDILEENVNEISYEASVAGSSFSFDYNSTGFNISFSGWTQQLPKLARVVFAHLVAIKCSPEVFDRVTHALKESLRNWSKSNAMSKAAMEMQQALASVAYTPKSKLEALETITADDVIAYGQLLMREMFVEAYIHGSFSEEGALHLIEEFTTLFPLQPVDSPPQPFYHLLKPRSEAIINSVVENPEDVNSGIKNVWGIGYSHDRDLVMRAALIQLILGDKLFDELRTQQQLGYYVSFDITTQGRVTYMTVQIESESSPWELDNAIERFFLDHDLDFVNMSEDDLQDSKLSLSSNLLEQFNSMEELASYNWKGIDDGQLGFNLYKSDADRVMSITKEELLDTYREFMLPRGHQRAKLSIQVLAQRLQAETAQDRLEDILEPYPIGIFTELQECIDSNPSVDQIRAVLPKFIVEAEKEKLDALTDPALPKDSSILIIKDVEEFKKSLSAPPPACPYEEEDA